jgi:hypothetical protein
MRRKRQSLVAFPLAFIVMFASVYGASAREETRVSTAAASKRVFAICTADVQKPTHDAVWSFNTVTNGQFVQFFRDSVTATRRIDRALPKVPAPAAYRKKLDAFVADNSKMIAPEDKFIAVLATKPAGQRLNFSENDRFAKPIENVADAVELAAASDDVPDVCITQP